jgi:hypothetical protein
MQILCYLTSLYLYHFMKLCWNIGIYRYTQQVYDYGVV